MPFCSICPKHNTIEFRWMFFHFIMIRWDPWIKKRVNCLSCIQRKEGMKDICFFINPSDNWYSIHNKSIFWYSNYRKKYTYLLHSFDIISLYFQNQFIRSIVDKFYHLKSYYIFRYICIKYLDDNIKCERSETQMKSVHSSVHVQRTSACVHFKCMFVYNISVCLCTL